MVPVKVARCRSSASAVTSKPPTCRAARRGSRRRGYARGDHEAPCGAPGHRRARTRRAGRTRARRARAVRVHGERRQRAAGDRGGEPRRRAAGAGPERDRQPFLLGPFEQAVDDRQGLGLLRGERRQPRVVIPPAPGRAVRPLDGPGRLGLADQPGHQRLVLSARVHVLPDLDADDLRLGHLLVEELDDPAQLAADRVGDEDQPEPPQAQVRLHLRPPLVRVGLVAQGVAEGFVGLDAARRAARLEQRPKLIHRPVTGPVRGVLEQLPDHLAPDARVRAALDLDERRHRVLIDEQVVEAPAAAGALLIGDPHLAREQDPSPRRVTDLVSGQQAGMLGEQRLEDVLGRVRRLRERDELAVPAQVDAAAAPAVGAPGVGAHRHVGLDRRNGPARDAEPGGHLVCGKSLVEERTDLFAVGGWHPRNRCACGPDEFSRVRQSLTA